MLFRNLGPLEIGIILALILIIFGVGKLPQIGGAIGKSLREFRKARSGEDEAGKNKDIAGTGEAETGEKK